MLCGLPTNSIVDIMIITTPTAIIPILIARLYGRLDWANTKTSPIKENTMLVKLIITCSVMFTFPKATTEARFRIGDNKRPQTCKTNNTYIGWPLRKCLQTVYQISFQLRWVHRRSSLCSSRKWPRNLATRRIRVKAI